MKKIISILIIPLPWIIKRWLLVSFWKYDIHPKAYIGFAYVYPKYLKMQSNAHIGHFTVAVNLDRIEMEENSRIGRSNWITGFPTGSHSKHFQHQPERKSTLILGKSSAITKNHHIDCTNIITIGKFTTVAGYQSQFLTHSIDIYEGRQHSNAINIGDYCFISTAVKVLGGATIPDFSVLGAGAVVNKKLEHSYCLYAGVPARKTKELPKDAKYFNRASGFVY